MTPQHWIVDKLTEFIRYRHAENAEMRLTQPEASQSFFVVQPGLVLFVQREREAIRRVVQSELDAGSTSDKQVLIPVFIGMMHRSIYGRNQFVTLSPAHQAHLVKIYRAFLAGIAEILQEQHTQHEIENLFMALLHRHYQALREFALALQASQTYLDKQVVCSEYAPELQLMMLGIDLHALAEPVLDIGCGEHGHLVHYLRAHNVEAYGADRLVMASDFLVEADWLELQFQAAAWGSLISHMAFSNHFTFHHLYQQGAPERYARQYMQMLNALKPGGTLYYTPGLPFIEPMLPEARYYIQRRPIPADVSALAHGNMYATHVTRMM